MPLIDSAIKAAKGASKPYKLYDTGGLYMIVSPAGGKLWRLKYRFDGLQKTLIIGKYPDVSLREARDRRDDARKLLAVNTDPGVDKKEKAIAARIASENTFKAVADEFLEKIEGEGRAQATTTKNRWLAKQLEAELGKRPISQIKPFEVLAVVKKIEKRGTHETAKRVRAFASRVFEYAVITSRCETNPAASLGGALITPKVKHHAAIIDPEGVGHLLRAIDSFEGFITTRLALELAPHVFARPGELRRAEWAEVDLVNNVWRIPAEKMKMRADHVVPLSRQALAIFERAYEVTGDGKYVFPSVRTPMRPMSENTINVALRRLGYSNDEMTGHGFRSTASTLLNESGLWSADAIERALAHKDNDKVRAAYHRGTHWPERVRMAQWWSDYLDTLRNGGNVVSFERKSSGNV